MRRRVSLVLGLSTVACALVVGRPWPSRPALVWNTTASAPVGLYRLRPSPAPSVGDWLFIRPPASLASWLADRGYAPRGALLLKRMAAGSGQLACRQGRSVTIDGAPAVQARSRDRWGRALPLWNGCRRLTAEDLFLLNPDPDSLDSRYLGPVRRDAVVGRAELLFRIGRP